MSGEIPIDPTDPQKLLATRRAQSAFIWSSRISIACAACAVGTLFVVGIVSTFPLAIAGAFGFGVAGASCWSLRRDAEKKLVEWTSPVPSEAEWLPVASAAIGGVGSALLGVVASALK